MAPTLKGLAISLLLLATHSDAKMKITPRAQDTQHVFAGDHAPRSFVERSIFGSRSRVGPLEIYEEDDDQLREECYSQPDSSLGGLLYGGSMSFAHLPQPDCFSRDSEEEFDIAIVGAPFDLGVSYRPGARFGPAATRLNSRRFHALMAYSTDHPSLNPLTSWAKVVDCGDIINTPFDKLVAIKQLQKGSQALLSGKTNNTEKSNQRRAITIGGDHTISLPAVRALSSVWGPVAILHFDSHLDTWDPKIIGGGLSKYSDINHGSMFHMLAEEGSISNNSNMHLGTRSMLMDEHADLDNDARCGFSMVKASDIDRLGVDGIVDKVKARVKDLPTYVSIDIDSLDPAFAPATGTLEAGGWTTRELFQVLRGLSKAGINIVGADVVEFSPVYDNGSETTGMAVAHIVYELLLWLVQVPVLAPTSVA
ncbi:arginase family protein [Ilyonectria destructans]|nr:arginase family protein [Ilyonectria destructans]